MKFQYLEVACKKALRHTKGCGKMKVERISDNQVKIILYASDLSDRNINISELAYGTEKITDLFREMMEHALLECGVQFANDPLMIEASPLSSDSLMVIITRIDSSGLNQSCGMNFLKELGRAKEQARKSFDGAKGRFNKQPPDTASIFIFDSIDEASLACARIMDIFDGESALIKKDGLFYLVVDNNQPVNRPSQKSLNAILCEYGRKQNSSHLSALHLIEYGEVYIHEQAVCKLARL